MVRLLFTILAFFLFSSPALADPESGSWVQVVSSKQCQPLSLTPGHRCKYEFTDDTNSESFTIEAPYRAKVTFDPNIATTGTGNATVQVRCADRGGDLVDGRAEPLNGLTLDGTEPDSRVFWNLQGPSTCWIHVVATAGGQTASVTIEVY